MSLVEGAHLAATLYMAGLIWFVQLVHYPLFRKVGEAGFTDYELAHTWRTSWVVGPPMLIEIGTGLWMAGFPPEHWPEWLALAAFAMTGIIWLSTIFLQMPMHSRLNLGYDARTAWRLAATNWIRTVCWTVRAGLVLYPIIGRTV